MAKLFTNILVDGGNTYVNFYEQWNRTDSSTSLNSSSLSTKKSKISPNNPYHDRRMNYPYIIQHVL